MINRERAQCVCSGDVGGTEGLVEPELMIETIEKVGVG